MRKLVFSKALIFFLICLLSVTWNFTFVYGDVIWEPQDNFYERERENCDYVNRTYFANGEKGYVTVFKNPKSRQVVTDLENGEDIHIIFTYEDKSGRAWGITQFNDNSKSYKTGWMLMDELIARYDHISFYEDHQKELVDYDGSFDPDKCEDKIVVWKYPGADVISSHLYMDDLKEYLPEFSYMYTDSEGKKWAHFTYYMGRRNGWVCLTDPNNENLPTIKVDYEGLIPASKPDRTHLQRNGSWLFIGLVAGLVMVTAILIKLFYGNKNKAKP
jgi:hypothetical protein